MRIIWITLVCLVASAAQAQTASTSAGEVRISPVVTGLDTPWAIGLLPDGGILVTERDGDLLLVSDGDARRVAGVPEVVANGQGGLLDVTVARNFAQTREFFLTYSKRQRGGAGTALSVARSARTARGSNGCARSSKARRARPAGGISAAAWSKRRMARFS